MERSDHAVRSVKADSPDVEPAPASEAIGPRVYGVIDVVRAERIAGWAIDRSDSDAAVEVDIYREGRLVRTVKADRHRRDLAKGEVGSGNYGFAAEIEPPIEPGFAFTLAAVARTGDGASAALKRVGVAATAEPERRLLERLFEETVRLGRTLATRDRRCTGESLETGAERLLAMLERVEVVQARLETSLRAVEPEPASRGDRGLRAIALAALAIAVGSLGLGLFSILAS